MNEQHIDAVGKAVANQSLADHILAWDRKQAPEVWDAEKHALVVNTAARLCQVDASHGRLQMHASGHQLMCCATRPTPCEYAEPVSR